MSFGTLPRASRRTFVPVLFAAMTVSFTAAGSTAFGNDIFYWGTQPAGKPAFGQTVMLTGRIARYDDGKIADQWVELWFSGRHGVRDRSYWVKTDKLGRFNAGMTIPRWWVNGIRNDPTWVDVTVACPSIGVAKLFRVRNK